MLKVVSQDITFQHITPDDGLSQISVNDLYQDERNFIWIATREGLNCYNGANVTVYKKQRENKFGLLSNNILRITGDKKGNIFLLCAEGVVRYSIEKDAFSIVLESNDVTAISYNDELLIARDNKVFGYNESTRDFDLLFQLSHQKYIITSLFKDKNGSLYIGTSANGVFTVDKNKSQLNQIISTGNITSFYQDSDDDIWIGSWENGLYRVVDNKVTNYRHKINNPQSIQSDFTRAVSEDSQGNIWVGTLLGLSKFDKETETFKDYTASNEVDGLTNSSIWCIMKDHQGTLWIGTYFGGVNYFNPEYEIYTYYPASKVENKGLSSSVVGKMTEDKDGNLWICTEGGGVNVFNRQKRTFKWYKHDESNANSLSHNNVKSIYYDEAKDVMWIGTHLGGLNKLDLKPNRFTHFKTTENGSQSLPSNIIRDIVPYKGKLLLATHSGVVLFDPSTGQSNLLFQKDKKGFLLKIILDLFIDHQGILWISVEGEGIFKYDFESEMLENFDEESAPANSRLVYNIIEDQDNNLWFSTADNGLQQFNRAENKFEHYNVHNSGLISDCIYEVREADANKLLVISSQGFSVFDKDEKKFTNYNKYNGFPLTTINEYGLYLTKDGEIFLGGVKGMVSFNEKSLSSSEKPYNILFSRLYVNNKEVKTGDETGILKKTLSETDEIILESSHSIFSVEYTATNYISANRDDIIFKLEGFSDDWTNTKDQPTITYTNLNAGEYTLIVKNESKNDSEEHIAKLRIKVLPPFYKTGIAYTLYFVILATGLFFMVKTYKDRLKLETALKYEQKHLQDIEELNQTKLRFFTNISHEFRTPLTLIVGQIEMLLQAPNIAPVVYNKILQVYKNSIQLKDLISELLDFRKQEQGHMKIRVSKHNIVEFLYENYFYFVEYAALRQINLNLVKEISALDVWFDGKQMQKVINNLLSNAFKYTKAEDTISITIRRIDDRAIIEIKDTGTGINDGELTKIFDRFYQTDQLKSMNTGTGIGLALTKGIIDLHQGTIEVESEEGRGSIFTISLQLGNEHFSSEQINEEEISNERVNIDKEKSDLLLKAEGLIDDVETKVHRIEGAKILIVEDNDSLRDMLSYLFEPFYTVLTASDGEEGLEMVKEESPDIVLSDVVMPRMTGTELCKAIKKDIDTCHIPVVLLTAKTAIEHNLEGLKIGADDYITKPFNTNLLVSRCNNLVNNRIMLKEKFSKQPTMDAKILATNPLDKIMMDKATSIIDKYLDDTEFTVDKLAEEIGMARTVLYKKFKAVSGKTPNDFIMLIRLKKAAYLLKNNPEHNVSDISYMTGFSTPRYFSTCFKNHYNVKPSDYRNSTHLDENQNE